MQHVLVALQCEESSCLSILIKSNFSNFTLWMPGAVAPFTPPLHGVVRIFIMVQKLGACPCDTSSFYELYRKIVQVFV